MHLLILVVTVAGGVLTAGLPQYQPPSSPQKFYKGPLPAYAPRPAHVEGHNPMYTYAEVNTPYYQYHYYSPVYKNNYPNQPPLFQTSLPESSVRKDGKSYDYGASTTLKNLFYPSDTNPLISQESDFQNNGYTPGYEPSMKPFSPTLFGNTQEVSITSKPLSRVNNAFSPVLRTYQPPVSKKDHPVAPISTPTELAVGFPNIFRERFGNDRDPEDPLTYQGTTFGPDLIVSDNTTHNLGFKPTPVPESLATPSSTIIKDDIRRRGISPQLMLRDQIFLPTQKISVENSLGKKQTFISTPSAQFSQTPPEPPSLDALSGRISANILRVFSSPNLELPPDFEHNTSVVLQTEIVSNDVSDEDVSKPSDSITQSTPEASTQTSIDTTVSHRQKIAKKIKPTPVPKKFLVKHPNVLFYSPGHDIPH